MSERISGISIGLDMDTAAINRSLSSIKDSFREVRGAARTNINNIRFDDKNIKTYRGHVSELSKTFEAQGKNVEDLKKQYDMLEQSGKANTQEGQRLRNEINKQVDEYNRLGHELDQAREKLQRLEREDTAVYKIGDAFETAGPKIQAFGGHVQQVGGFLTKWITAPAVGAIAAIGGITAAFGWGRLVGLDTAQAQLRGLGYDTESVGRISDQVTSAIEGGMTTMAEGTAVAAGAMAAGVEEGEELERYIKLVGDAAVGSNRPVGEMAQIFNRVQGSGKLMTQELNMIEQGMPGFAQAMADNLGVTQEEFRKMVTDGEVGSAEFMDVMEDFAGGMAEAYADSWQGMVANTKAYVGIIGENLLSGVFEQSKESIAEFIEFLKSDEVVEWAESAGEAIGNAFSKIVESVKGGINWFMNLDDEKKKLIGTFAAVAVAAGPILTALGGFIIVIGQVMTALGPILKSVAMLGGVFKVAGIAIGAIFSPIGLVVAAVVGLGAAFVLAYNKSETFRDFIAGLAGRFTSAWESVKIFSQNVKTAFEGIFAIFRGDEGGGIDILQSLGLSEGQIGLITGAIDRIKSAFQTMKDGIGIALGAVTVFAQDTFAKIRNFWATDGEQVVQAATKGFNLIRSVVSTVMPVISGAVRIGFNVVSTVIGTAMRIALSIVQMVWENIKGVINGGLNIIMGLVKTFSGIFTGDFSKMWEGVKQIFSGAIELVWNGFQLLFWGRIIRGVGTLVRTFSGSIRGLWQSVVGFFQNMFQGAVQRVTNLRTSAINIVTRLNSGFNSIISRMVSAVVGLFQNLLSRGVSIISNLRSSISNIITNLRNGFVNTISRLVSSVVNLFQNLLSRAVSIVTNLRGSITNLVTQLRDNFVRNISNLYTRVTGIFTNLFNRGRSIMSNMSSTITNIITNLRSGFVNIIQNLFTRFVSIFTNLLNRGRSIITNLRQTVVNLITRMRDGAVNGVTRMRDQIVNMFTRIKNQADKLFSNMVDGAKALPGRLGDAIKNGASKAVNGVKSLGNSMVGKLGDVVNGVIKGLNSITSKIGITATISEWTVPQFSRGTGQGSPTGNLTRNGKIAMDTLATVGDKGPGNGPGTREMVRYPNGKVGLYDNDATIFAPKGTTIFSNQETEALLGQIPQFSEGTGFFGKIKNIAGKAIDYITNPSKIFEDLIGAVFTGWGDLSGFALNMVKGAWNIIKDGMLGWITDRFSESSVGKSQKWMDYPMTTPYSPLRPVPGYPTSFNGGRHYGIDYGTPVGVNLTAPMAGTVKRQYDVGGGNVARLESGNASQYFLHMRNVKTGKVGIGDSMGKSGNTGKFTTGPHVHWQHEEPKTPNLWNKRTKNPLDMIKEHMNGGLTLSDGLFSLHKGEYIINPDRPKEAMKLIALASQKLAGKSKQTSELPNPGGSSGDGVMMKLLEATMEQNKILMRILKKDTDVILDGDSVKEKMDERDYNDDLRRRLFSGKKRGVTAT